MLRDFTPVATLAVGDLSAAATFYEQKIGFTRQEGVEGGILYTAGSGSFFLYESSYAGTNKATALSFQVPSSQFDAEVEALRAAGVPFETFEAEGLTWADGVASMADGGPRAVWFKDPDGNFLNIDESPST